MTKTYDPVIADAKRRARRLAKETGGSYQASLQTVAKASGRSDWNELVHDPAPAKRDPDAYERLNTLLMRLNDHPRTPYFLSAIAVVMMVPTLWAISQYLPWVPKPPLWMTIAALAVFAGVMLLPFCWYAALHVRIVRTCARAARTGVVDVEVARASFMLVGMALWVPGILLMLMQPGSMPGLALGLGAWIPVIIGKTIFKGPNKDRSVTTDVVS